MMVAAAAAASLILNTIWLRLVARRGSRLALAMAATVGLLHGALLINAVADVVHLPMAADAAALAWHAGVLPLTLGLALLGRAVTRRRRRATHAT